MMSAAYAVIENPGAAVSVTAAGCDGVGSAALHESVEENGMMRMRPVPSLAVPAEAYYGVQTARAVQNFPISGLRAPADLS